MPVPDTSILVPLFDADHPHHARARRAVGAPGPLHVSGGVLAELTTVLRRRGSDVGLDGELIAREALERLEALQGYRHASEYDAVAVSRLYRTHSGLSYVDAWGIALALGMDEQLLTLDARQRAVYRRERAREPGQRQR
ncbi:MAG: PIN domain-containing protein [bacterium]